MNGRAVRLLRRYANHRPISLRSVKRWYNSVPRPLRHYAKAQMAVDLLRDK